MTESAAERRKREALEHLNSLRADVDEALRIARAAQPELSENQWHVLYWILFRELLDHRKHEDKIAAPYLAKKLGWWNGTDLDYEGKPRPSDGARKAIRRALTRIDELDVLEWKRTKGNPGTDGQNLPTVRLKTLAERYGTPKYGDSQEVPIDEQTGANYGDSQEVPIDAPNYGDSGRANYGDSGRAGNGDSGVSPTVVSVGNRRVKTASASDATTHTTVGRAADRLTSLAPANLDEDQANREARRVVDIIRPVVDLGILGEYLDEVGDVVEPPARLLALFAGWLAELDDDEFLNTAGANLEPFARILNQRPDAVAIADATAKKTGRPWTDHIDEAIDVVEHWRRHDVPEHVAARAIDKAQADGLKRPGLADAHVRAELPALGQDYEKYVMPPARRKR